jgi:hypothetical protein
MLCVGCGRPAAVVVALVFFVAVTNADNLEKTGVAPVRYSITLCVFAIFYLL